MKSKLQTPGKAESSLSSWRPRMLITTSTFPIQPDDGIPRFVLDLAQALTVHGQVFVLAPDAPGATLQERIGDVEVSRFSYFHPRKHQQLAITNQRGMRENMRDSHLAKLQVPLFFYSQARQLNRLLRQHSIDVVNAHWLVPQGLVAARVLRKHPGTKLILHVHAGDVYFLQKQKMGRRIARYVVDRSSAVFADGSHVRDALDELLDYPSNAVLQPMGVHQHLFSNLPNDESWKLPVDAEFRDGFVLFFGRLSEKKGTIYLIQALAQLRSHFPELGLVIIGSGPEKNKLRNEVEALGLQKYVFFTGRQSHEQIIRWLHACRAAAVPSIIDSHGETEGMPTVIVEALAAGVPVVGSRVNGIPDVILHKENGWLCEEKNPQDLADKLREAVNCDRQVISTAATQTATKHDWSQVADNYWACVERIVDA